MNMHDLYFKISVLKERYAIISTETNYYYLLYFLENSCHTCSHVDTAVAMTSYTLWCTLGNSEAVHHKRKCQMTEIIHRDTPLLHVAG